MSEQRTTPLHKYCPKCRVWRDLDGVCCEVCGTMLVMRQLNCPEPVPKHDGKLDGSGAYEVSYWQPQSKKPYIYIEEMSNLKDEPEYVHLTPAQTLSLLAWLKQEEPTLERLVKEQAE